MDCNHLAYATRRFRRFPLHRLERAGTFWSYTPFVMQGAADILHTFNMLPINCRRFVVTSEMEIPRYLGRVRPWQTALGHRLLQSSACKGVLTLSQAACRQAQEKFKNLGLSSVADKITVFRGAVGDSSPRPVPAEQAQRPLRALFVGRNAFRKGLVPTLDAVDECRAGGVEIELTVVSSLDKTDDYIFHDVNASSSELRQRIADSPWIHHHDTVRNSDVRAMMRHHDVLVLPTLDESLGWVIVEAGMEECPTIATDVYAIPELIDDRQSGHLLRIPLNAEQRWVGLFSHQSAKTDAIHSVYASIRVQLVTALSEMATNLDKLAEQGQAARRKMLRLYGRAQASERLESIYSHAVS